jgi:AraC-like DNA-binding protein
MSPRSLYNLFEKHAGTTPKNYIRNRKLESIRACLNDPSANVRSITEIALDYGFLHLGRFAENYRSAFGELPSDTLRQCKKEVA